MTMIEEIAASQELKQLVDTYANESDKNNQDYYVNIFTEDCRVRVYFNGELGMDLKNVHDLIAAYKGFGAAKAAFHMNGQQKDGADMLTTHAVRYEDRYVRTAAGWRIAAREQYFMFSDTHALGK